MWYLFLQIWGWLVAAFVLGWLSHCFWTTRDSGNNADPMTSNQPISLMAKAESSSLKSQHQPDDLQQIRGIGSILSDTLNRELGVYTFAQIAAWTDEDIAKIETYLKFSGRVQRENWIEQAKVLTSGDSTEVSDKVS
jgi:NADH-quinone oxidoreductase subunit E